MQAVEFVWRQNQGITIKSNACQNKATDCDHLHTREVFHTGSSHFLTVYIFRPDLVILSTFPLSCKQEVLFSLAAFCISFGVF